ncbi:P-loop containing nucleoside triphosphate hydrolase protein [Ceratobasidium sp. AG-I]|nr:P-loop containing nucleoside triphosphate hydrolase protein [Ceratobasidium sp. AG-I]
MDIFKKLGGSGFLKRSSKDIDRYKTELNAKVLFVGNFCGKSALIWAQVLGHKNLDNFIDPPIFECHKYSVTLRPYTIHMEIQDTRGQEDYARLNPLYYLTSDIIVMLFQIGNPDTLHNLEASYQPEINRHGKHKPRLVVGCQLDQRHDPTIINELLKVSEAPVSQTQGINMAKKLGAWGYAECSARDYNGVAEVFDTIAQMVVAIRMQPRVERPMPFFVVLPEHSDVGTTAAGKPVAIYFCHYGANSVQANDLPIAANIGSQSGS